MEITVSTHIAVWLTGTFVVAVFSGSRIGSRVCLAVSVLLLPLPFFVTASSLVRLALAAATVWVVLRAADLAFDKRPPSLLARWGLLVAVIDTRLLKRRPRTFDGRSAAGLALAILVAIGVFAGLKTAERLDAGLRYPVQWLAIGLGIVVGYEMAIAAISIITGLCGLTSPPVSNAPLRSRTISEFWAKRWNLVITKILYDRAFKPLARRGTGLALMAAFCLSALIHTYAMAAASGASAAASWAIFFLVQPLVIAVERHIGVRHWPDPAGRVWAITVMLTLLPLIAEPLMGIVRSVGSW